MTWSERLCALSVLMAAFLAGCGQGAEQGFLLLPLVQAKRYAVGSGEGDGLSFPRAPELLALEIDHERRPVVLTAAAPWRWRGRVPPGARLFVGAQALPAAWKAVQELRVTIAVRDGGEREIVEVARMTREESSRWLDFSADLAPWAGREVAIELSASFQGLPAQYRDANLVAWSPVVLSAPPEEETKAERPNVLFILVDTLRHDRLTPYGYRRDTTPEIQRRLADHGAVVENAYSQAPWTLPSVVSFMTGRYPGELLDKDMASYGIPAGVAPLAERMAELGYQTGGFVANPTMHAGAGFGRGFRTYYAPPADVEWIRKHADELNRHALPWLRAFQRRPFFLYVHYIDPHDPYENPDMIGGRSPYMPDYTGPVAGNWIHGIYNGHLKLQDPERDIAYINALYDSEVRYVDRFIGELLAAIDPQVLKDTLIVLTADHGEELHDHGGWKHGQTLYEEQIHVPLIFRWDGRIRGGTRLGGTVRLVDLLPTLVSAAGGKPDPAWDGVDLLPALTGAQPPPRRPAFAEGMSGGPLRAAAVLDGRKLVVFNREEPFQPADELQAHLWQVDLGRLRRAELYDLERDPGERRDLAASDPGGAARLAPVIHRQVAEEAPGLWVIPDGLPAGSRLSGSITFERAPRSWVPYLLGPADRAELNGTRLRFDLTGESLGKGLRIEGDFGRIAAVEASLDGRPVLPASVRIGSDTPYRGGMIAPVALRVPRWPAAGPASGFLLRLWIHEGAGAGKRETGPGISIKRETEKRLRNLGYIQ
ncbi:MAG TPA: sulfatase [Thermoanaerobaculia bacterium]